MAHINMREHWIYLHSWCILVVVLLYDCPLIQWNSSWTIQWCYSKYWNSNAWYNRRYVCGINRYNYFKYIILYILFLSDLQVDYCCRENGTVILEGCITVGTEPFEQLDGQYITIGPFYAPYQCAGINNYKYKSCWIETELT